MRQEKPSRVLLFYSLFVSGLCCLIYCLAIALFINPEMEEYVLIIVMPFLGFIAINGGLVFKHALVLDSLIATKERLCSLNEEQVVELDKIHYFLTYRILSTVLITTILLHGVTMWIEDGSFDFFEDPDSWSLLLNRGSLFLLIAFIQGSVFDQYLGNLKNKLLIRRRNSTLELGIFKRLTWMLVSLSIFLGSSIPIFSTMRFDNYIDDALPSMSMNIEDSEELARDLPILITMMEDDKQQFAQAQLDIDQSISFLRDQISKANFTEQDAEAIDDQISKLHDNLPLIGAFETGMDTQNTVSYAFILMTMIAGIVMSSIYASAFKQQIQHIRQKINEMLSTRNSVSGRLNVTGLDETANLAADFNLILEYNEDINAELLRADKVKDAFLANVSHELKTPLHGIIGISESLTDGIAGSLPDLANRNLQLINASGRRLSSLVNDILDFSKLKEHDISLILKPLDLKTLVDVVLELSEPTIKSTNVKLVNRISPELCAAEADENRLQQVLINLVGNAIKFTDVGEISVSAMVSGAYIEVCVCDDGIGIAESDTEAIFQSFEQADTSVGREYGGSGLGLSISKNLVELHGGTLRLESEPGIGSQFYFTLPISLDEKQGISVNSEPLAHTSNLEEPEVECVGSGEGFTILVVDDEPVNLTVLSNHLSANDYRVIRANNGEEAIALFEKEKPDIVLLDIMMPRMSGFEVCRKLREKASLSRLPIIMLTAKDQAQDLAEGFSAGANDYISKPFTKKELLSRIKTHLELAKINRVYSDFVPSEYLNFLGHESILDVRLGDNIHKEMTIMFADIRSYTSLSESLSPQENFDFINEYLKVMGPCIKNNNGFVNHYLGDGLMALFPGSAEDAVKASIEMYRALKLFNRRLKKAGKKSIKVGVGLHYGKVIFGIIGDVFRKSGNVISDDVNISSRLEGLNKSYGSSIIVSESVLKNLENSGTNPANRYLGQVIVKGRKNEVAIYELLDVEEKAEKQLKLDTQGDFERGLKQYLAREFGAAADLFRRVLSANAKDSAAQIYLNHCVSNIIKEPSADWNGAVAISEK